MKLEEWEELANRPERLHSELEPYLTETPHGVMLNHPLVQHPGYVDLESSRGAGANLRRSFRCRTGRSFEGRIQSCDWKPDREAASLRKLLERTCRN